MRDNVVGKPDMKTGNIFGVATVLAGLSMWNARVLMAQTPEQILAAKDILTKTPAAELASRAAQLVVDAPASEKAAVASAVAQAIASINPDLTSAAVASISLKVPVVAPAAAAAAAGKLPASAPAIAVAAASVQGVKPGDVRTAVIAAVPQQAAQVVSALSRAKLTSSLGLTPWGAHLAKAAVSAGSENKGVL